MRGLDMKKRFTEEQIFGFLGEAEAGLPFTKLCRQHDFSKASHLSWRSIFGSMNASDATPLKKLFAESMLDNEVTREALR